MLVYIEFPVFFLQKNKKLDRVIYEMADDIQKDTTPLEVIQSFTVWFKSKDRARSNLSNPDEGKANSPRSFPVATYNDAKSFKSSAIKDNEGKAGVYR